MAWALLSIAGILEIAFAFCMKWPEGFTRLIPGLFTVAIGLSSFFLLSLSLRTLPVGLATRSGLVGEHRDSGNGGAGRPRCAAEDARHCSHFGRRDREIALAEDAVQP
jgi:Small Multidrug Resistance (SMR) protein